MDDNLVLNEIHVANYKSLVDTDIKLHAELTALIGLNGSGKTSTLGAVKLLRQLASGNARHRRYGVEENIYPMTEIIASFTYKNDTYRLKAELYLDNIEVYDEVKYFELYLKRVSKMTKWTKIDPEAFDFIDYLIRANRLHTHERMYLPDDEILRDFLFKLTPFLRSIKYYGATVFSDPSKSPISFELEEDRSARRPNKRSGHQQFLYDLYILKYNNKKAYQRYINAVNHLGVNLVDDIDFSQIKVPNSSVKIKAGGMTEKITSNRVLVVPIFSIGTLQLSPNQLSEGTFKTLALIFYILNDNSKLMLIEEPEVCVHHGLLSNVMELIKDQSKYKQIVVSTHSDYVLDKISPENVSLVRKSNQGTIVEPLQSAMSKDDYRALKLYLNDSGNLGEYWKEDGFSFK